MFSILLLVVFGAILYAFYRLFHINLPPNVNFSFGIKVVCAVFNAMHILGLWLSKLGINRWKTFVTTALPSPIPLGIKKKQSMIGGVRVLMVFPEDYARRETPQPVIMYFHGGGWTISNPASYLELAAILAKQLDAMVALPDYRKAPEYPFPVPYQDCLDCTKALLKRSQEYNIDKEKVVLTGDSAGGNLSAAIALVLPVRFIALIYPSLQFSNLRLPSFLENKKYTLLTAELMGRFILAYMGLDNEQALLRPLLSNEHTSTFNDKQIEASCSRVDRSLLKQRSRTSDRSHPILTSDERDAISHYRDHIQKLMTDTRMAPLTATDDELKKLPPVHVLTCEYDVLRDDGIMFAERLKRLGNKVSHQHLAFGIHAIISAGVLFKDQRTMEELDVFIGAIKKGLIN